MTAANSRVREAVERLRQRSPRSPHGPVPLGEYFLNAGLDHVELPGLTRQAVFDYLRREGVAIETGGGDPHEPLAGFLVTAGRVGWAFVNADDILPRRRFTAAHELGHFLLHREEMESYRADTPDCVRESEAEDEDRLEAEANRFAADLLMPAEVCQARADELQRAVGCCPREVLAYRLASELLVSRQAMRYRLKSLEIGHD